MKHMSKRILIRLWMIAAMTVAATISLPVAVAHAQGDGNAAAETASAGESFASAFFISRVTSADGKKSIDYFGSALLWVLLLLSVSSFGMIGMMAMTNQRKAYVPAGVVDKVKQLLTAGKFREALELTAADESYFSKVFNAALREGSHGFAAVIRMLQQSADELATVRLRRIEYLNILAPVSPMIGLFGPVGGMILAFRAIVLAGGNADPVMLAGGIGTALTTTFWGLLIAIPALAAYAIIRNRIDEFTTDATRVAEELLNEFRARSGGSAGEKSTSPKVHKSKGSVEHSSVAAEDAST
jgi:biopolymer transport protein ExbB